MQSYYVLQYHILKSNTEGQRRQITIGILTHHYIPGQAPDYLKEKRSLSVNIKELPLELN